jgi:hypothetical protein
MYKVYINHTRISCLDLGHIPKISHNYANDPKIKKKKVQNPKCFQSWAFWILAIQPICDFPTRTQMFTAHSGT